MKRSAVVIGLIFGVLIGLGAVAFGIADAAP